MRVVFNCRGHGTYTEDEKLMASVAGEVERVNKLICVRPLKTRCLNRDFILNKETKHTYKPLLILMELRSMGGCGSHLNVYITVYNSMQHTEQ